jgi:hypothetical protein
VLHFTDIAVKAKRLVPLGSPWLSISINEYHPQFHNRSASIHNANPKAALAVGRVCL